MSWIVRKHCPRETFLCESRYFAGQIIECPLVITQSISRCINISLRCLFQGTSFFGRQSANLLFICSGNCFLNAWRWLTKDLLSQFITPIRDRSVNNELLGWINHAKWKLCIRRIEYFPPFLLMYPRSNELVARKTWCPLFSKLSSLTSAVSFHFHVVVRSVPFFLNKEKTNVPSEISLRNPYHFESSKTFFVISILCPFDVVEHWHEDNSSS